MKNQFLQKLSLVILICVTMFISNTALALTADDVVCTGCVGTSDLATAAVGTTKIKGGAVTTAKISDGAVTSKKIQDFSIVGKDIRNGAIGNRKLLDNAVTGAKILNGTVTNADLAVNSVYSAHIVNGQVLNADIGTGQVNSIKITDNSVTAVDLAPNSVGASEIATSAVGALEIATSAVGQSEIATNGVASAEVQDNTLTHLDLQNEAGVEYFQFSGNGSADVANPVNIWQASYTLFVTAPTTGYVTCMASVTAEWDISSAATFSVGWDQDNTAHLVAPDSYTRVALPFLATNAATEIPMNPMHTYAVSAGTHSYTLKLLQSGGGISDIDLVRRSGACMFFPTRY